MAGDDRPQAQLRPALFTGLDWLDEHGNRADPDEVGFEVAFQDGTVCIAIGCKLGMEKWELTPTQEAELVAFLYSSRSGLGLRQLLADPDDRGA